MEQFTHLPDVDVPQDGLPDEPPAEAWLFQCHPSHGCGSYMVFFEQKRGPRASKLPRKCPFCGSIQLSDRQTTVTADYKHTPGDEMRWDKDGSED